MAEFKICNKCCLYTDNFIDGLGECVNCIGEEPKIRKAKRYKKLTKEVFEEKFSDHRQRVKEDRERERNKRRKLRANELFF